jgi:hypothetical protein
MENIQNYRQPMVTATGIFLGFMLSFATGWVGNAFTKHMFRDIVVAVSIILSITLLLVVLYRMLNMDYPADKVNVYYRQTLRSIYHCCFSSFYCVCTDRDKNIDNYSFNSTIKNKFLINKLSDHGKNKWQTKSQQWFT